MQLANYDMFVFQVGNIITVATYDTSYTQNHTVVHTPNLYVTEFDKTRPSQIKLYSSMTLRDHNSK